MTDIEFAIRFFNGWKTRDEKDRKILPQNTVAYNAYTKEIECFELAIKALKQESFINKPCVSSGVCEHDKNKVLDKIRAEIEARLCDVVSDYTDGYRTAIQGVLAIIDNYKEV